MKSVVLILSSLVLALSAPAMSWACRYNPPPMSRALQPADVIVVARVTRSVPTGSEEIGGWTGEVQVETTLLGKADTKTYGIGRSWWPGGCSDGAPAPPVGERWVLYLRKGAGPGDPLVMFYSYPLHLAREWDERLALAPR